MICKSKNKTKQSLYYKGKGIVPKLWLMMDERWSRPKSLFVFKVFHNLLYNCYIITPLHKK